MAEVRTTPSDTFVASRVINIILGVWLFISAFIWPHSPVQYANTWILGLLCVVFALAAFALPWTRYLNTLLAIWLFISAFVLPHVVVGTVWNNALVAIAIFVVSLLPEVGVPVAPRPRPRQPA